MFKLVTHFFTTIAAFSLALFSHQTFATCPYCNHHQKPVITRRYYQAPPSNQAVQQRYYYPNVQQTPNYVYPTLQNLPPKSIEIRGTNVYGQPVSFYGKFGNSLGDYDDY